MRVRSAVILILMFVPAGCTFRKTTSPTPPAPLIKAPPATPAPAATSPTATTPPATLPPDPVTPPQSAPPTLPAKPVVRRQQPQTPPATPVPSLQLGEILTSAQQAEMTRTMERSVGAARATLARLRGRQLTSDQSETVARIRTFADQAEQARKTDLRSAMQLARRAEVLARDLEANLQ